MSNSLVFPAKIAAESLLSFYPTFVKKIDLGLDIQLAGRLATYGILSTIMASFNGLNLTAVSLPIFVLLTLVNISHIFFSYYGFEYLPSGIAYTLFYTFPVMIAAVSGHFSIISTIITLLGVYLIAKEETKTKDKEEKKVEMKALGAIIMAAVTEVAIYLIVRRIKVSSAWQLTFFTYIGGCVLSLIYLFWKRNEIFNGKENFENKDEKPIKKKSNVFLLMLLLNGLIGAVGYTLRFYSSQRMNPIWFAILSYLGIIFAFIYGKVFNNDVINKWDILGTILIVIGGILL